MPTVLVADDEKNILQLARMYLQAEGFTVETAGNGREALDKVRTAKPDLLARNPGVVFDRERLLKLAWGYDYYGDSRTVDVHVTWLREKLRESTARIQTVWGIGYKLVEAEPGEAAPARRRRA